MNVFEAKNSAALSCGVTKSAPNRRNVSQFSRDGKLATFSSDGARSNPAPHSMRAMRRHNA
eukprot:4117869-Pyramimonas_sp.AAC.1